MTLAAVATLSASCGFLEVEQVGKSDIDTYFSEVSALQPALNGCYHLLYSFYDREMLAYPEVTGDRGSFLQQRDLDEPVQFHLHLS